MKRYLSVVVLLAVISVSEAQTSDSLLQSASLQNCVQYAIKHQPVVQQALLDEEITERQIRIKLADWYPQLNFNYNYQYNFQLSTTVFGGSLVKIGANNQSLGQLALTQTVFNRDVLLANRTANDVRKQAKQNTVSNKIDITVNVSKAFYDVLLTQQQIALDTETIARLDRSFKNAYDQYTGGIVDKIDYKRAVISLNNAKAQKHQDDASLVAKYAYLRDQIDDEEFRKLKKAYPRSKWADLADWDLLDNKVCGDWQGSTKCPQKESEMYEKYAQEHPDSPRAAEALYNAVYRQGALNDIYSANGDDKKAGEAKARAVTIAGTIAAKYPQSDYAARAASLVYQLQESIPIYGADRQ